MQGKIVVVPTKPIQGQRPGTSGLRKLVSVVKQEHFLENFVQAIFDTVHPEGQVLVIGGDGRYYNTEAIELICRMAAANKVKKLIIGENGILSTPASSCVIRKRNAFGGIILTASHNPGGPNCDFGIKYNCGNGGPAPEAMTEDMYARTLNIHEYRTVESVQEISLKTRGIFEFEGLEIEIIESCDDYVEMVKSIFDFALLRTLFKRYDFRGIFDSLNGVTGPYSNRIFIDELCESNEPNPNVICQRFHPLSDFGGVHPDPNLTYAADFVDRVYKEHFQFGSCWDGDGDRNMILGDNFFLNPCDSIAIIAANTNCIPYFRHVKGVARSMPTSSALDHVAGSLSCAFLRVFVCILADSSQRSSHLIFTKFQLAGSSLAI